MNISTAIRAVSLWSLALLQATAIAGDTAIDKRIAADPHGSVSVSNVSGRVEVRGWGRPEVQVTGALGSGVERMDLVKDGNNTIVKVVLPHMSGWGRSQDAKLLVSVPAASRIDVSTVSADLSIANVSGPQSLHTVSGDVAAEIDGGDFELKSVSGDLTLHGSGQAASMRVSTVSGDVRLTQGAGSLELTTVSGDVHAELKPASNLRVHTTSGDMHLDTMLTRVAKVDLETVSGDLNFHGPSEGGFTTEVTSFSGDITTCFGAQSEHSREFGPGSKLRTSVGAGAALLRVKTLSGDVSICDK